MTSTERLRALLDERGVEWRYHINDDRTRTWFNVGELAWFAYETPQGYLVLDCSPMTPEQAIAATLGAGTCKDVCAGVSEFTCSKCGFNCDLTSWISLFDGDEGKHRHHHHGTPNYCPNCGRRVMEVDE